MSGRALVLFGFLCFLFSIWVLSRLYRHPLNVFYKARPSCDAVIEDVADRYCVDPLLIKAVIWCESRFDPDAKGAKGEVGLMQIRPEHGAVEESAKACGIDTPKYGLLYVPELNVEIGTWYLAKALRKWRGYKHRIELALSEYNAGASGMSPWIPENSDDEVTERITIASTRRYVRSIMDRYATYQRQRSGVGSKRPGGHQPPRRWNPE
jgi:soluble lytic murein transglycosylase